MRRALMIAVPVAVAAILALVLFVLPELSPGRTAEQSTEETTEPRYKESPILRERVERGELPPVEERLPENPVVVDPPSIGRYSTEP